MNNKTNIRKTYKAFRKLLTKDEVADKSIAIANKVLEMNIWNATYYHVYLPIIEQNEVDTQDIMHVLFGKDKEVVVSKSDFNTSGMTHYLLTENTVLKKNAYNIPEPQNGLPVPVEMIDVVFVPLLAFDNLGNRIGYGKGFYDRFLSTVRPDAIKIGLSFFEACEVFGEVFESDIRLDFCVTPEKVYDFRVG
jgi:5-formyltetrahydrofolate cyclo-ligase